jgi:DNA-directed RNA polymerase specialized sigma24 family protein
MHGETEKPLKSRLHQVLDQVADASMSEEYWDKLFYPLRDFLINRLRRFTTNITEDELPDAADEIILRLYRYFDFGQLQGLSEANRQRRFHGFVKRTVYSVMIDRLRQKGISSAELIPKPARSDRPRAAAELVAVAFKKLHPDDQELLRYKTIERLTYKDIQDLYRRAGREVSVGALKMRALRALDSLRQMLSDSSGGT